MSASGDNSIGRRPDGSIDIEHYVALAQRARASEARALRSSVRSAVRGLLRRPSQARRAVRAAEAPAIAVQVDQQ